MKRILFIIAILFLFGAGCGTQPLVVDNQNSQPSVNSDVNSSVNINTGGNTNSASDQSPSTNVNTNQASTTLPANFLAPVSFASQAPLGDWGMPYQEACEEASMITTVKYFKKEPLDANIMNDEILKVVKWETDNGYPIDLTSAQVVEVLDKYFGVKARLDTTVTTDEVKKELVAGNLIILPLAGREIGNPNYTAPGPLYHMLVVRGYDKTNFITNDPGTRHGEAYKYKYSVLLNAVHDWTGGVRVFHDPRPEPNMDNGARVMVVVEK